MEDWYDDSPRKQTGNPVVILQPLVAASGKIWSKHLTYTWYYSQSHTKHTCVITLHSISLYNSFSTKSCIRIFKLSNFIKRGRTNTGKFDIFRWMWCAGICGAILFAYYTHIVCGLGPALLSHSAEERQWIHCLTSHLARISDLVGLYWILFC